jgi:predicted phage terminase large subunit-like protein
LALVDESSKIYSHFKPTWAQQRMRYTFPSGASISFMAVDSERDQSKLDGLQMSLIVVDEAQNNLESNIIYLQSRLRSEYKGKHQLILTGNPRYDCYLRDWVEPLLDEDGVPVKGVENIVRWFVRLNNKMHWADTKEELLKQFPNSEPLSFRYVHATCLDNPKMLENNPQYISQLKALKKIDYQRLFLGSWYARAESTGYFKREWCEVVDAPAFDNNFMWIRSYDLASSPEPSEGEYANPDYTVGTLMTKDRRTGTYYVVDVVRYRKRPNEVVESIIKTANEDGLEVPVSIPRDTGSGGLGYHSYMTRVLSEAGIYVKTVKMSGWTNKLTRFLPFASLCEGGNVKVVRGDWNEAWFDELEAFDGGDRKKKDDQVDATSDAFKLLATGQNIPVFEFADMSRASNIPSL